MINVKCQELYAGRTTTVSGQNVVQLIFSLISISLFRSDIFAKCFFHFSYLSDKETDSYTISWHNSATEQSAILNCLKIIKLFIWT